MVAGRLACDTDKSIAPHQSTEYVSVSVINSAGFHIVGAGGGLVAVPVTTSGGMDERTRSGRTSLYEAPPLAVAAEGKTAGGVAGRPGTVAAGVAR